MTEQINGEITLKERILKWLDWVNYFRSKWLFIVSVGAVCASIGLLNAWLDKPIYTAELTLALEEKSAGGNPYSGIASQFGLDIGGAAGGGVFSGENNIELLKSRVIIESTLLSSVNINGKKDLLVNRYIEFNGLREIWENKPALVNVSFKEGELRENFGITKDSILYAICKEIKRNGLSVSRIDKKISIITVKVKSQDELFAKLFTEKIVETASDLYIYTKTKKSRTSLDVLEFRLDSVKRALDREIAGAAESKDNNVNLIRAVGSVKSAKKQLNVQVLTTMYGELVKNAELTKYTLMREEPLIQIIDRPILPLDKVKKGKFMGLITGGVIGTLLSVFFLLIRKLIGDIMK